MWVCNRFDEMITDAPNDIYITAFFLNPGGWQCSNEREWSPLMTRCHTEYRDILIYKKPNPLATPPLRIMQKNGITTSSFKPPEDIIRQVGLSLQ
jgi:hypothetical protein